MSQSCGRLALRSVAVVTTMLLTTKRSDAQQSPPVRLSKVASSYEMVNLGKGAYAFVAPEAFGGVVGGNSTVIIGDSAVLVVDTGNFPDLTLRMIADIRRLTTKPVRYVVNTHWHPDHWMGNAEYAAAFPGVNILSTEFTRSEIISQGPKYLASYQDTSTLTRMRTMVSTGKRRDGTALSAAERHTYEETITDVQQAQAGWRLGRIQPPNLTFDRRVDVHLGGRDAQVMFLGRGNTAGDAVVFVPDLALLATGDLVVAPTPYAYDVYAKEWIETLKQLDGLAPTVIVPGHGPVEHDRSYLSLVTQAVTALRERVLAAAKQGKSLDDVRKTVTLDDFLPKFAGDDPDRRREFELYFVTPGVKRAYAEATFDIES